MYFLYSGLSLPLSLSSLSLLSFFLALSLSLSLSLFSSLLFSSIPLAPADLQDRRVEITGPAERKMVINALNSGASCFMADFEDSNSPTWHNNLDGQINLRDAVNRTISHQSPEGKQYRLNEKTAVLLVRPRGWHLVERHFLVDGEPMSG